MKIGKYCILIALLLIGSNLAYSQEKDKETLDTPMLKEVRPLHIITPSRTYTIPHWVRAKKANDDWQRKLYIKTNATAYGLAIGNVAVEVDLARNWSVTLPIYYSALNYFSTTVKFRTLAIQPELRYWIKEDNTGWFIGTHLGMGYYNIATNGKYRYQDHKRRSPALGGGFSGGYAYNITKNKLWRMECSLGAGVYRMHYDRFHNYTNGMLVDTKKKTYFGIDQVNVSFVYTFNLNKKGGAR